MIDSGTWHLASNQSEFLQLESDWERLFETNPRHSPFLAWGWVNAWLKHIAGQHELAIACLRDDNGALSFILPLIRLPGNRGFGSAKVMLVCSFGPDCSEKLGCLCAADLEPLSAELSATAIDRFIDRRDTVSLECLDNSVGYPSRLEAAMQARGRNTRLRPDVACPTVSLPASWEEYLGQLSSNFRSQVRRSYRQVGGDDQPSFQSVAPSDAEAFSHELIRLNRSRMRVKGETSSLEDEAFRTFLHEAIPYMALHGIAWLDTIERDGVVLGSALNFLHGESVYFYMGGFDDSVSKMRPGSALFALVIQRSIDGGCVEYDFLRGSEAYKYRWRANDVLTQQLIIYPRGLIRGFVASLADNLHFAAREVVRRLRDMAKRQK